MKRAASLAAAGGIAAGAAFWGGAWGLLAWVGFVPLYFACDGLRPRAAFFCGWVFGVAFWATAAYWTLDASAFVMGAAPWKAAPAGAAAWVVWGLPWAGAAAAAASLGSARKRALALAAASVAAECFWCYLYPPALALTQLVHLPAVQSVSVFGLGGIAWLIHGFNAAVFLAARGGAPVRPRFASLAAMIALGALNEGFGRARLSRAGLAADASVRVAVLQGAIPSPRRRSPDFRFKNVEVYRRLIAEALERDPGIELFVWPQDAYEHTIRLGRSDADLYGIDFQSFVARDLPFSRSMILGVYGTRPVRTADGKVVRKRHRAAVLKRPDGGYGGFTAKRHPTPFSETMPFSRFVPALKRLSRVFERVDRGPRRVLDTASGARVGVLICYDAVLRDSARLFVHRGATLLVGMSNDAWSSSSRMHEQNLGLYVLRALETNRSLVRAVGTGVSAVVDPYGRIVERLDFGRRGVITVDVPLRSSVSPNAAIGDWPYYLAPLVLLLLLLVDLWPPRLTLPEGAVKLRKE